MLMKKKASLFFIFKWKSAIWNQVRGDEERFRGNVGRLMSNIKRKSGILRKNTSYLFTTRIPFIPRSTQIGRNQLVMPFLRLIRLEITPNARFSCLFFMLFATPTKFCNTAISCFFVFHPLARLYYKTIVSNVTTPYIPHPSHLMLHQCIFVLIYLPVSSAGPSATAIKLVRISTVSPPVFGCAPVTTFCLSP